MTEMKLADYIGKKLTDIGIDDEENTLFFEFTGGHRIVVRRENVRTAIIKRPKETADEAQQRKAEIAQAKKEAKAEANAKKPPTRKPSKKTKTTTKK